MKTPTPLLPNDRRIRDRRYHVTVHGPRNDRGARPFIAEARFASQADAQMWADDTQAAAPFVNVSYLSARTGWRRDFCIARRDGVWSSEIVRRIDTTCPKCGCANTPGGHAAGCADGRGWYEGRGSR